jgi:hypothetical protein
MVLPPAIHGQIPEELRQSKTLILCPASLIQNWRDQFAMLPRLWFGGDHIANWSRQFWISEAGHSIRVLDCRTMGLGKTMQV